MSRVKCSRKGQLLFSLVCIVFDCEAKKKTNKQRLKPFLRDPPTHTVTWEKKNEERDKTIEEEFWGQKCLFEKLLAMSRAFIEKKRRMKHALVMWKAKNVILVGLFAVNVKERGISQFKEFPRSLQFFLRIVAAIDQKK